MMATSTSAIQPGRRVRISGLQNRPELNGLEVAVIGFVAASGRWGVQLVASNDSLAVRPENLVFDGVDFCERLGNNDDLLSHILEHLDIAALSSLRASGSTLAPLARAEICTRAVRWRFEHDWRASFDRHETDEQRDALFERAWVFGGFASDQPSDWFGRSNAPRDGGRPHGLRLRVGDMFRHKQTNFVGYVVGWDARTRAPYQWVTSHRRVGAPGTCCTRLFAPHLSVREFYPDSSAPQGVGFQTRYVIEDSLEPFDPDGVGMAEAQAVQDGWFLGRAGSFPRKFLWRVLTAIHNDGMLLGALCQSGFIDELSAESDQFKILGGGTLGDDDMLWEHFEGVECAIRPRRDDVPPRGEEDLVFRGSARLAMNAEMRKVYPCDV